MSIADDIGQWSPLIVSGIVAFLFWYFPAPGSTRRTESFMRAVLEEHLGPGLPHSMGIRLLGGPVVLYGAPPPWFPKRLSAFWRRTYYFSLGAGCGLGILLTALVAQVWYARISGRPPYPVPFWTISAEAGALLLLVTGLLGVKRAGDDFNRPLQGSERDDTEAELRKEIGGDSAVASDGRPQSPRQDRN